MTTIDRRSVLVSGLLLSTPLQAASLDTLATMRRGTCAVLLRHARTEAGVGDPPGYRVEDCSSQRNLSAEGRAQAQAIGRWFSQQGLKPAMVRSSRWCRCLETARLAFGRVEPWPALDSFFDRRDAEPAQTALLRRTLVALQAFPAGYFEVWVTHMVNIAALAGEPVAMGEALVLQADRDDAGRVHNRGRLQLPA